MSNITKILSTTAISKARSSANQKVMGTRPNNKSHRDDRDQSVGRQVSAKNSTPDTLQTALTTSNPQGSEQVWLSTVLHSPHVPVIPSTPLAPATIPPPTVATTNGASTANTLDSPNLTASTSTRRGKRKQTSDEALMAFYAEQECVVEEYKAGNTEQLSHWFEMGDSAVVAIPFDSDCNDLDEVEIIQACMARLLLNVKSLAPGGSTMPVLAVAPPIGDPEAAEGEHPKCFLIHKITQPFGKFLVDREIWSQWDITIRVIPLTNMPFPTILISIARLNDASNDDILGLIKRTCILPVDDAVAWHTIRDYLFGLSYYHSFHGLGKGARFMTCTLCHAVGHPCGLCPFPQLPSWVTPGEEVDLDEAALVEVATGVVLAMDKDKGTRSHNRTAVGRKYEMSP
ncbi:hypothetical protein JAAARDRAFT_51387 [Jaapia argillacea MUCL 33604]|uniref:Uncharacterized protein n=1 Tax=Jaapia argillacea MUCL 33604 TaxID=933084 RepID=A0A067P8L5_9AGAM|nr:hypothetical protein JAAARDRAFT_51387 [Jaapia argillacea MUCL 33604]